MNEVKVGKVAIFEMLFHVAIDKYEKLVPRPLLVPDLNNMYLIKRNIIFDHASQTVDQSRQSNGSGGIAVAMRFITCSSKVKHCIALQRETASL